jgi:hypothetical protein
MKLVDEKGILKGVDETHPQGILNVEASIVFFQCTIIESGSLKVVVNC